MKPEIQAWFNQWSTEDQAVLLSLRETFVSHLPEGFDETVSYGMLGYVVPHTRYPQGYHVDPSLPLPFVAITKQKHYYAVYHLGLYAFSDLSAWFESEYTAKYGRLDHGKSCLRFKSKEKIPLELLGILAKKISVEEWIAASEANRPAKR